MVFEGGDIDVHVPGGKAPFPVFLLKVLFIVDVSLNIIGERILPVFIVETLGTSLW